MGFDAIIRWSLRNRGLVLLGWLLLAAAGAMAAARLPLDAFPDTTPTLVHVNTVAPSLTPDQVEQQLTRPVELALAGLPDLAELRSVSKVGLSQVTLVFGEGADLWRARQVVAERLGAVVLAPGVDRPQLGPVASGLGEVFHYLVRGPGRTAAELRAAQDLVLRPQLRAVPGVAEVNSWGGDERRLEVVVDPRRLDAWGLTLDDLADALQRNHATVGGGPLTRAGEATLVQGAALLRTVADVEAVAVATRDGVPVRVQDVARVQEGREPRQGAATADGEGEVVLGLGFMTLGENSAEVTRRLDLRLSEAAATLPEGITAEVVYRRTDLVERVLATVRSNLVEGALWVLAVLLLFLGDLRAGLVVAAVIPLSLAFAAGGMLGLGVAGSLMSLGALDFGLIVDAAIVQVENAARRLAERPHDDPREVIADAAVEVRRPTMYGELILLGVYLPVLTLEGVEGRLFRPMAITVALALVGAGLASLTLVPVLTSLALRPRPERPEPWVVRAATALWRPVLRRALDAPVPVLGLAALLLANAAFLATRLGTEFVPRLQEGAVVINTVRLASVSLDESVRYSTRVEQLLRARFPDEVARVWTRTGTAEIATDPMGVELSDVFVSLTPRDQWTRAQDQSSLVAAMRDELAVLPGMRPGFTQPIEMRVNEMAAGVRADVGVKLFGDDLARLREKAREIEAILRSIPGSADVSVEQVTGLPVLRVDLDPTALARHGLTAEAALRTVEAIGGLEVAELVDGERRFSLAVRLDEALLDDPDRVGELAVTTPTGDRVPLASLARITTVEGPSTIPREWGRRRIVVQANVRGRDLGGFVEEARARVDAEVELPGGWYVRYGGQFEHYERARDRLLQVVPMVLALIGVLLHTTYGRAVDALRVFTGVPFAAVGGVVALWLRGMPLSVSAAVGFIALSGVSVLGDMVLVSTIRRQLDRGLPPREAVERAVLERLRPVLMTGLVAALGFLPMALNDGVGAEVQRPLATVVIGGLASSTALTLLVLPALYLVTRRTP